MAKKIIDETLKFSIVINGDKAQKEYGKLTRANKKLLNERVDLENEAKKLKKSEGELSNAYKKAVEDLDKNTKAIADNDKKMHALTEEIGINKLTQTQLTQVSKKLTSQLRGMSKETNPEEWEKLTKQLIKVKSRQKELGDEMKLTTQSMDNTVGVLEEFGATLATVFAALRAGNYKAAAAGFKGIAVGIKAATKAAWAFITTPLGAMLATLVGIASVTKLWFDYNVAIAESTKLTRQLTDFDGDTLEQYRASVSATAKTFDKEFNEVLRSANSLSKQMKISQQEALDHINNGFIRGADLGGDFLDKIREYPIQFKNAGFSAQDFIDIATQEATGGIYNDKLVDALKEADLALKEMTKTQKEALVNAFGKTFAEEIAVGVKTGELTTKEAIGRIIKESEKIGLNYQQQQQLVADVFKGAGEDAGGFAEIILQLNSALSGENKILNENEKATERLVKANIEYEQALADLFDASSSGFPAMLTNIKAVSSEIFTNVLRGFKLMFTSLDQLKQAASGDGQKKAFEDVTEYAKASGKTVKEEADFLIQSSKENIHRLRGEIADVGIAGKLFGTKDALETKLAENEAYLKELQLIAQGESKAFIDFQKQLEEEKLLKSGDNGNNIKENEAALKALEDFEKRKRDFINESALREEQDDTARKILKIKQDSNRQEEEINNLNISNEQKKELLALNFEEETKLIDEQLALKAQKEAEAQWKLYDQKKEIENQIALDKAESDEERELLKAEQEAEKAALDIERSLLNQQQKDALLLLIQEKGLSAKTALEKKHRDKKAKEDEKAFKKELSDRKKLQNDIINGAIDVAGRESKIGKALLAIKGVLAAKESLIQLGVLKNTIATSTGKASAKIAEGTAETASKGFPQNIPLLIGFALQVGGIISAIKSAASAGKQVKTTGFEEGLYPVTRKQDGKSYKARVNTPQTQIANNPTILVGERPELIVDPDTFKKMDPQIVDYIMRLSGRVSPGFESGLYKQNATSPETNTDFASEDIFNPNDLLTSAIHALLERLEQPIEASANIGDDEIVRQQNRQKKLADARNNAKIK